MIIPQKSKATNNFVAAIKLQQQGRLSEAEKAFRDILAIEPKNPYALYSLGVILIGENTPAEALALFQKGCESMPSFAENWFGCGIAFERMGLFSQAHMAYDEAIKAKPTFTGALINSGAILRQLHQHHTALIRFNDVLKIDPNNADALYNSGTILVEVNDIPEAIVRFKKLLSVAPDYGYGLGSLAYARLLIGDWSEFDKLNAKLIAGVSAGKLVSKTLSFMAMSDSAEEHLKCAQLFSKKMSPPPSRPLWSGGQYQHTKLRVAYISPDLREHPVGHLMCGIFEKHDKSRIETIAISLGADDKSQLRQRMLQAFDHFIDARLMSSRQIAEKMREMEVDIAIDLGGYTADTRIEILSYRPAPVSINFLGYPGTLAVSYIDYILADKHIIPEHHKKFYSEQVLYMPDTYLPTDGDLKISDETPSRESCGLPTTGVVFCSFSHDYKINPQLWKIWMSLLEKTPGSVLWLTTRNKSTETNLRRSAKKLGIEPKRIILASRVPNIADHLARYRLADIFLDTWPYNAHTTAADALFAGLPVITYTGNAFPARVAGSLLNAVGLPELITHSWEEYAALALNLAKNPEQLSSIKQRLSDNKKTAALFDTGRFCKNLEDILYSVSKTNIIPTPQTVENLAPKQSIALPKRREVNNTNDPNKQLQIFSAATKLLAENNFSQAELYIRSYCQLGNDHALANQLLDRLSIGYGLPKGFELFELEAHQGPEKYLIIRAWGYGFWSDVHHVLGQLLLAELTHRTPLVWWGENSLFSDSSNPNAFELYFEPIGQKIPQGQLKNLSIFPFKWSADNIYGPSVNTWQGVDSRMGAPLFFNRSEDVLVSDFYATVASIKPWISQKSSYSGLSDDEIYTRLCNKYLRPQASISQKVDSFYEHNMQGKNWVSVHIRGSDKIHESPDLWHTNKQYYDFVDRIIELNPSIGIFLLTDSLETLIAFQDRYGDRVLATPALRTDDQVGIHLQKNDGYQLGQEVLVDVLLAIRGDYFIGNFASNVSMAIASLKQWPANFIALLGGQNIRGENWALHNREFQR